MGLLLASRQELGCNRGKTGRREVKERRNGLDLVGKSASDGRSLEGDAGIYTFIIVFIIFEFLWFSARTIPAALSGGW